MMAARLANSGGRGQKKFSACGSTRSIALSSKIYVCILCHSHLDEYQVRVVVLYPDTAVHTFCRAAVLFIMVEIMKSCHANAAVVYPGSMQA